MNDALGILEQHGVVTRKPNRGYFLSRISRAPADAPALPRPPAADDIVTQSHFAG